MSCYRVINIPMQNLKVHMESLCYFCELFTEEIHHFTSRVAKLSQYLGSGYVALVYGTFIPTPRDAKEYAKWTPKIKLLKFSTYF